MGDEQDLREVYARYFFSLFDASHHQDALGRREAHAHLEDFLASHRGAFFPEGGQAEPA